ncbi:uncharacterized protein LOC129915549 [Episyrphus balteatus]|uniref:uncharacterized protein LOC129915549 n=1 Tax=Episyrphus balteatus TaxID=286459 RepID=UPI002484FBA4|nr:uncharacterized protein LOC129915549 [Episyrphus balteatus]
MFSSAEFVEEWNQIFSFKIKEVDLAKPTETFVFNALINYLQMFNFDTSPMIQFKNSENATEKRAFLVRFCNYIDHIYKISDKSHCFFYYDLKHPSPKKTVHMLNHLLNYFFYYNMFKESIVPLASAKIRQRQNLIDEIQKYKFEHEQIAIRAKNIEKYIKNYIPLAPQTLNQLNEIIKEEATQKDVIIKLEEQLNECNSVLESLREKEAHLTMKTVSKEEVESLLSSKNTLARTISEQETIESATYSKNQERAVTLAQLQTTMSSIEDAKGLNSLSSLQSHKEYVTKFKELESKFAEISRRQATLKTINEKLIEDLKQIEKDIASKNALLKDMKVSGDKQIDDMKMLTEANEASIYDLEHELHNTEKQLAEEKDVTEYILETTALLVRATIADSNET